MSLLQREGEVKKQNRTVLVYDIAHTLSACEQFLKK